MSETDAIYQMFEIIQSKGLWVRSFSRKKETDFATDETRYLTKIRLAGTTVDPERSVIWVEAWGEEAIIKITEKICLIPNACEKLAGF